MGEEWGLGHSLWEAPGGKGEALMWGMAIRSHGGEGTDVKLFSRQATAPSLPLVVRHLDLGCSGGCVCLGQACSHNSHGDLVPAGPGRGSYCRSRTSL